MPSRPDDAGNNEALLAWAEGTRFAFRVDGARAPEFHAWVEDYHFDSDGPGTLLSVGIGSKPRRAFRLAAPVLLCALTLVLTRACHDLEHGRWHSRPSSNSGRSASLMARAPPNANCPGLRTEGWK